MCAAMWLILVLITLTLNCVNLYPYDVAELERETSQCDGHSPELVVTTRQGRWTTNHYIRTNQTSVTVAYGTALTVTCFGDSRLAMTKDGAKLHTNETESSISWTTNTPNVERSEYVCTDSQTRLSVIIAVTPAFKVILEDFDMSFSEHIIQYGSSMSLLCSGPVASQLVVKKNGQHLLTENINGTTIKWFVRRPDLQKSVYSCIDVVTGYSSSERITVEPAILIKTKNTTIAQHYFDSYVRTHVYRVTFRDSIEVICSGPRPVKLVSPEDIDKEMLTEYVNETTVKSFIGSLRVGKLVYGCIDVVSNYMTTVRVEAAPRMAVTSISPVLRRTDARYEIKSGNPLEIICFGPDAKQLYFSADGSIVKRELYTLNENAVKWVISEPEIRVSHEYVCAAGGARTSIVVDVLPDETE